MRVPCLVSLYSPGDDVPMRACVHVCMKQGSKGGVGYAAAGAGIARKNQPVSSAERMLIAHDLALQQRELRLRLRALNTGADGSKGRTDLNGRNGSKDGSKGACKGGEDGEYKGEEMGQGGGLPVPALPGGVRGNGVDLAAQRSRDLPLCRAREQGRVSKGGVEVVGKDEVEMRGAGAGELPISV